MGVGQASAHAGVGREEEILTELIVWRQLGRGRARRIATGKLQNWPILADANEIICGAEEKWREFQTRQTQIHLEQSHRLQPHFHPHSGQLPPPPQFHPFHASMKLALSHLSLQTALSSILVFSKTASH